MMNRSLLIGAAAAGWLWLTPAAAFPQEPPSAEQAAPQLAATGFVFPEGLALDEQGDLYVATYRLPSAVGRVAPDGTAGVWCDLAELAPLEDREPRPAGVKLDSEGRLIVADAGGGRVLRIVRDGSESEMLTDRCDGVRFRSVQDVALDLKGNIYFTDPGGPDGQAADGAVYRYDIATKRTVRLASGLAAPYGLAVSPDQAHLCVAESGRRRLLWFDLSADGLAANRRVLVAFPDAPQTPRRGGRAGPCGLVFDRQGRIYVAMGESGLVNVVAAPEGRVIRQYNGGGRQVTNCHFHGGWLYTTVASKEAVFRLKLGVEGFAYNRAP